MSEKMGGEFYVGGMPKNPEDSDYDPTIKLASVETGIVQNAQGEYSPITLIEEVNDEKKYISEGGFGKVYEKLYKTVEDGKEIILVKKEYHSIKERDLLLKKKHSNVDDLEKDLLKLTELDEDIEIHKERMSEIMEIQKRLKSVNVPVLDLYTDGESFYSPLLNTENTVAISGNNDPPNINHKKRRILSFLKGEAIFKSTIFEGNVQINNLDNLLNNIEQYAQSAAEVGVKLSGECLLFLVEQDKNDWTCDNVVVGDYDIVELLRSNSKSALKIRSLRGIEADDHGGLISNIKLFIIANVDDKRARNYYLKKIFDKFDNLKKGVDFYIDKKLNLDVIKLFLKIPHTTVDLENMNLDYKDEIKKMGDQIEANVVNADWLE